MRADRLVAALLFLQARGQVTAAMLAEELEISERTARRDLEALAMAGIPVYSQAGRGGGWSLVGGATTDLSGLTGAEVRTLFLIAGPSAATPPVKAALRKLVRALPETFRAEAEAAASAVMVDPTGWDHHPASPPAHLEALQKAVIEGVQIRLSYKARNGTESDRTVSPLGLVAKRTVWYLIANTEAGLRTFRVGRVRSLALTGDPVDRPEDFDLEEAWRSTLATLDEHRVPAAATLRAYPALVPTLRAALGTPMEVTRTLADGRLEIELRSYSPGQIAVQIAGFGGRVEVIAPDEVRRHLERIASELAAVYAVGSAGPGPTENAVPRKVIP
ncbi:MAG TPA: YafY family protein [Acidimicrobiales bacterium]|nr:YafY family protein [Acidimicrobiales bacterium]